MTEPRGASLPDPEALREHLIHALNTHPGYEPEVVLESRRKALGIATQTRQPVAEAAREAAAAKHEAREEVTAIRGEVWKAPVAELIRRLDALPLDDQPQLRASEARLRAIAAARDEVERLSDHDSFEPNVFGHVKQLLAGAPGEAAEAHAWLIGMMHVGSTRRPTRELLRLVRKEAPTLYQLESARLDEALRTRGVGLFRASGPRLPDRPMATLATKTGSQGRVTVNWWVFVALLMLLGQVLRYLRLGAGGE